jgi:hypothetical protein
MVNISKYIYLLVVPAGGEVTELGFLSSSFFRVGIVGSIPSRIDVNKKAVIITIKGNNTKNHETDLKPFLHK